jgi:diguanylate cyclase (GGDEF)-like protein/PAS domain S-box-containing protein
MTAILTRRFHPAFGWALLGLVLVAGAFLTAAVTAYGRSVAHQRLEVLAITAAAAVNPERVTELRADASDFGTPAFDEVRQQLARIKRVNPEYRFVYLMTVRDGKVVFLADAEPPDSPDYSAPGDVYDEAVPEIAAVMASGVPDVAGPYRDRWGEWVTGLAPVAQPGNGAAIAVLGIDLPAKGWQSAIARYRGFGIAVTALVAIIVLLLTAGLHLQAGHQHEISALNARLLTELEEIRLAQEALRLAAAVFQTTEEGIMVIDAEIRIRSVNPAFERITGYSEAEVLGRNPRLLESGRHDAAFFAAIRAELDRSGRWQGIIWNRTKAGRIYPQETVINALKDEQGRIVRYAALFRDVTLQKQLEETLRQQSAIDGLTGIANRRSFDAALEEEWGRGRRQGQPLSLVMADIDHFKHYNDQYGHQAGDRCLQQVAQCLKASLHRAGDLAARYGGEEFAVILPGLGPDEACAVAEKLRQNVEALGLTHDSPSGLDRVTISLGVATARPAADAGPADLIARADQALYQAKRGGRNRVVAD